VSKFPIEEAVLKLWPNAGKSLSIFAWKQSEFDGLAGTTPYG
jgi:hypothetical protein